MNNSVNAYTGVDTIELQKLANMISVSIKNTLFHVYSRLYSHDLYCHVVFILNDVYSRLRTGFSTRNIGKSWAEQKIF